MKILINNGHNILVHTISHAECCHKGDIQPVRGLFHLFEQLLPLADILRVGFLDDERTDGELHLTKVDDVVSACNKQVNLRFPARFILARNIAPRGRRCGNAGDTQALTDLRKVGKTDQFKRISLPGLHRMGIVIVCPPLLILAVNGIYIRSTIKVRPFCTLSSKISEIKYVYLALFSKVILQT